MRAAAWASVLTWPVLLAGAPLARAATDAGAGDPAVPVEPAAAEAPPPRAPAAPVTPAPGPAAARRFPRLRPPSPVHTMQFGVALLPGSGFRSIFPYQENVNCGQLAKRVCTGRIPVFLDAELSFGIGESWDALVALRFGIEQDFTQTHQFAVAPGFRYWVDPDYAAKFFTAVQLVIDTTNQANPLVENVDFGVRNANGFMVDIMRNLGVYLQFGVTLGFRRWLRFEIDGGVGVQARFP